ncbi:hypothetical protein [Nonomuraea sp. NPDC050310]|uniref:ARPP-2 domain-containing protein n=1 Tax=unclassified Nonomuraea TaxID=2593643 RepID=UPI0033CDF14B
MIEFTGLVAKAPQTWGGVRLVPLVRPEPIVDLRLHPKVYGDELSVVALPDRSAYVAYVPHAFVASWSEDGSPAAAYGTQLGEAGPREHIPVQQRRGMARRTEPNRLRFLPLHLALEGFLSLHFKGPSIAWAEWSQRALRHGLSPRGEEAYTGAQVRGLDDALRVFEIHPGQCGVAVYVSDALAAAFVVPHQEDYRALHPTLVRDLYGELIHDYAWYHPAVRDFPVTLDESRIASVADLRSEALRQAEEWAAFHATVMAGGLHASHWDEIYRMGRFTLRRFLPSFERDTESHLGETITTDDGRLAYLKTFRLSEPQRRRGYLLTRLAAHDWNLAATATALGCGVAELGVRLERAGFGHLLRQDVLDGYRKAGR